MKMLVRSKPKFYSENSSLDCSFRMSIKQRNNSTSDCVRTQEEKPITIKDGTRDTVILSRGSANAYSTLWWPPLVKDCTQSLSSDPTIKPECHGFSSFAMLSCLWGISTSWNLSPLQSCSHEKHKRKGGKETHTRLESQQTHTHTSQDVSTKHGAGSSQLK